MSLKYQIMIFCACVCFGMRVVRSMLGVGNDSTVDVATRGHMFSGLFYGCCRHHSTASMATPLCVLTWFIVFE